MTSCFYTVPP